MTNTANELLWEPSNPTDTEMFRFISYINSQFKLNLKTYEELREFSVTELSKFWSSVWSFCKIKSSKTFDQVIDESIPINKLPKWFQGARLNYAENLLRRTDDHLGIIGLGETLAERKITFKELSLKVGQVAVALRRAGVKVGDRVAGLVPNCPDAAIFMLASACIGAVWSSASPDFGPTGILDRFSQIEPKILVSVEAVMYNGKVHDNLKKLSEVAKSLKTVEKVIVMPFIGTPNDISFVEKSILLMDFLMGVGEQNPVYEQLPFDHPLAILFSSGTTGVPKCIVHSQGGTLIQHLKEHIIHGSMGPKDVFFYYSTTGWMMWNWLLSGLATGATVILYDGNPMKPEVNRLWKMVEEYKVTIFGTSAKYIQNLEEIGYHPNTLDLSSLHSIYSTGSELKPKSFEFIYKHIKKDLLVGSITGGTDIISLFAGHCSALPVHKGEIQCRSLGMAIEAWDESGKSVLDAPGDLVCTKPFPCMPIYFFNDKDGTKYQSAYFSQMKGVWYHGDYMQINSKTGGVTMLGRSDGTLNPAGVRFGSAELYNIMTQFPQVQDSLAVGQKIPDGERVVLFLKMQKGHAFNDELVNEIKLVIKTLLSARHVPAVILPIDDIPYTLTGKKVEVAVKKIISGETVVPSSALANPDSLQLYIIAKSKF